jgi:hypothetical protein
MSEPCPSLSRAASLRVRVLGGAKHTFSRSILFIAESMPRTTFAMLPVTERMVTAVWTRELTASMREARRRRLTCSFFLRMALPA